jgi:hypothetical protein
MFALAATARFSKRQFVPVTVSVPVPVRLLLLLAAAGWAAGCAFAPNPKTEHTSFRISFPASLNAQPLTGRVFIAIAPTDSVEPRVAAYQSARMRTGRVPFFAADIENLEPDETAYLGSGQETLGWPLESMAELPAGDYYVQAILNVYTEFKRADGHTVWAHMDQWDGQRWAYSPGNLVSEPIKVRLDPREGFNVKLTFAHKLPPIEVPPDTRWVKRIKLQSPMLTKFWGHPIYVGASVLLPAGYDEETARRYPVIYEQGHFSLNAPFGFRTEKLPADTIQNPKWVRSNVEAPRPWTGNGVVQSGYEFYQEWIKPDFPRVLAITFQHPTPYFDDSYAVNSANNGPYGDMIIQELIPELERRFRIVPEPWARTLTGGSTGGWESLALQLYHPTFFGGTWTFFPDPIDFRRYQLSDIYYDDNAYVMPNAPFNASERPMQMTHEGQVVQTMRQISQMEAASGTRGRSAAQIDAWNAAYGPTDKDGYPRRLWDMKTGKIDREVAHYMRANGYDLREYTERNWPTIGKDLVGKLHILTGDMDDFYLAFAVYMFEDMLANTSNPHYPGEFTYGRPMKGHGWHPTSNSELVRTMARHMSSNSGGKYAAR